MEVLPAALASRQSVVDVKLSTPVLMGRYACPTWRGTKVTGSVDTDQQGNDLRPLRRAVSRCLSASLDDFDRLWHMQIAL